jgi:hypothetical protein
MRGIASRIFPTMAALTRECLLEPLLLNTTKILDWTVPRVQKSDVYANSLCDTNKRRGGAN